MFYHPSRLKLENDTKLIEFSYPKYGQHLVCIEVEGGSFELFDACKLLMEADTRQEYERIKNEAAEFAKKFVEQFNSSNSKGEA